MKMPHRQLFDYLSVTSRISSLLARYIHAIISAVLPATLHSVVVVGTDTFALDDVSRGVEVGAVGMSTSKIDVIYVKPL